MILAVNEMMREVPQEATFDFVKDDRGWEHQVVNLGNGSVIPVLTSEVSGPCLICDTNGTPLRVIEPSILG